MRKFILSGRVFILSCVCLLITACLPHGEFSQSQIDASDPALTQFTSDDFPNLLRYLGGNARWEVREERGQIYAVRREEIDGKLDTSLNGFYTTRNDNDFSQRRVLISFKKPYGFGDEDGNVTRTPAGSGKVAVTVEGPKSGSPGYRSYVIFAGKDLTLEIFEQSPTPERAFTQQAYTDVSAELNNVFTHREAIARTGFLPDRKYYPAGHKTTASFEVLDNGAGGQYKLRAALNPSSAGYIEVRVFDAATGTRLSEDRISAASRRYLGWSANGKEFFSYIADITVYEGDWSHSYPARFELWHVSDKNIETKMTELTRTISGWER